MEDIHRIKEKINIIKDNITFIIDNDFQYYFFIGQLAYFIEYESKVDIEACLESVEKYEDKNSNKILKEYTINRFSIYFYGFNKNYDIFRRIFSAILTYEPKKLIKEMLDWFYLGVYYQNIILDSESVEDIELKRTLNANKIRYLKVIDKLKEIDKMSV